ncbi:MAG TPA: bacillithiol system redox-active protein YtxJ [Candidatus Hydrogenedentes bacterium]|nr:bacillithiol system redox-active protein YtxJ [Candidatus Hydrogenedentota bacterium]
MTKLKSPADWDECLAASCKQPLLVFKHSTRCPISAAARNRLLGYLDEAGADSPPVFEVSVIESRSISNVVAETLGVSHQSPQLLLLKDRHCVWTVSHHEISEKKIADAMKTFGASPIPS